jgi:hypothetical protein
MIVQSNVGADGVLHLDVPVGTADANRQVQVTIEPLSSAPENMSVGDWLDWLKANYGTWQGPFERAEPLPLEERMSLDDASA